MSFCLTALRVLTVTSRLRLFDRDLTIAVLTDAAFGEKHRSPSGARPVTPPERPQTRCRRAIKEKRPAHRTDLQIYLL